MTSIDTINTIKDLLTGGISNRSIVLHQRVADIACMLAHNEDYIDVCYRRLVDLSTVLNASVVYNTNNPLTVYNILICNGQLTSTIKALDEFIDMSSKQSELVWFIEDVRDLLIEVVNSILLLKLDNSTIVNNVSYINLVESIKGLYMLSNNMLYVLEYMDPEAMSNKHLVKKTSIDRFIKCCKSSNTFKTTINRMSVTTSHSNLKDLLDIINRLYASNLEMTMTLEYTYKNLIINVSYNDGSDLISIPVLYESSLDRLLELIVRINCNDINDYLTSSIEVFYEDLIEDIINELVIITNAY